MAEKLPVEFYQSEDVVALSQQLLGNRLVTQIDGVRTAGIIVETEAYRGSEDRASHAFGGRRTARTETMYLPGGHAYIYLCYGIHHLFNVVTAPAETPFAILVRAVEPVEGIGTMLERRSKDSLKPNLTAGPGSMSQALGITTKLDATPLDSNLIWIEEGVAVPKKQIIASPRVGVDYAGDHARWTWRFRIKDNPFTSPAK